MPRPQHSIHASWQRTCQLDRVLQAWQVRLTPRSLYTTLREAERNNFANGNLFTEIPPRWGAVVPAMQHAACSTSRPSLALKGPLKKLKKSAPITLNGHSIFYHAKKCYSIFFSSSPHVWWQCNTLAQLLLHCRPWNQTPQQ